MKGLMKRLLTIGLATGLGTTSVVAQECLDPDQLVFSIIPTEETTQELDCPSSGILGQIAS